jgi:hypothetical protein
MTSPRQTAPFGFCQCGCGQRTLIAKLTNHERGNIKGQPVRFVSGHCSRGTRNAGRGWSLGPNPVRHFPGGITWMILKYKGEDKICQIWTTDYEKVRDYHWCAHRANRSKIAKWYAESTIRLDGKQTTILTHRLLLPGTEEIDHRNNDGLDNRVYRPQTLEGNIRRVSHSENMRNRRPWKRTAPVDVPSVSPKSPDIQFENHGSIILIRGLSEAGQAWLDENVGNEETQHFGGAIAAEPRYCLAIAKGAVEFGLVIR